jgi:hypothetical protein
MESCPRRRTPSSHRRELSDHDLKLRRKFGDRLTDRAGMSLEILFGVDLPARDHVVGERDPGHRRHGSLDLAEFHRTNGRQYIAVYLMLGLVGFIYGAAYGYLYNIPKQTAQNAVIVPMTLVALGAFIFRGRTVQTICAAVMLALYPVYFYVGQHALQ